MEEPIVADSALKHRLAGEAILCMPSAARSARTTSTTASLCSSVPRLMLTCSNSASSAEPKGLSSCMPCRHDNASSSEE